MRFWYDYVSKYNSEGIIILDPESFHRADHPLDNLSKIFEFLNDPTKISKEIRDYAEI